MKSNEDTTVSSHFYARRRNQILRTLTLSGGLSGGDLNVQAAVPIIGRGKRAGASASIVIAELKSLLWTLEAATA